MVTLVRFLVGISVAALALVSCNDGTSLQRYLVDKQDDDKYVKLDIATSLFESDDANFTEEQKEILSTIQITRQSVPNWLRFWTTRNMFYWGR